MAERSVLLHAEATSNDCTYYGSKQVRGSSQEEDTSEVHKDHADGLADVLPEELGAKMPSIRVFPLTLARGTQAFSTESTPNKPTAM